MTEEIIKEKLQEAYREILENRGIESGDISPEMDRELKEKENQLIKTVEKWVNKNDEKSTGNT